MVQSPKILTSIGGLVGPTEMVASAAHVFGAHKKFPTLVGAFLLNSSPRKLLLFDILYKIK